MANPLMRAYVFMRPLAQVVGQVTHVAATLCLCAASVAFAQAQSKLNDPMQPPNGFSAPSVEVSESTGPVLQSVMIPKKGKAIAMIGGQQVRVGEMYGDQRLTQLTEKEAVLEGPNGVERLLLTPDVSIKRVATKTPSTNVKHSKSITNKPADASAQKGGMP